MNMTLDRTPREDQSMEYGSEWTPKDRKTKLRGRDVIETRKTQRFRKKKHNTDELGE